MFRHVWLLVFFLQAIPASAEAPPTAMDTAGAKTTVLGEADHDTLRKLMVDATKAINDLDSVALARHLADGFVLTFADQTVITDLAQLDGYIAKYFVGEDAPLKSVRFVPEATEKVRFVDSRTGVVYGTSADTYTLADDASLVLDTRWTATVVKEDGRWLLQSFHAGVNMLDNPILEAAGQSGFVSAGIALIVGLLVGALLMRMFRRN